MRFTILLANYPRPPTAHGYGTPSIIFQPDLSGFHLMSRTIHRTAITAGIRQLNLSNARRPPPWQLLAKSSPVRGTERSCKSEI